MLARCMNLTPSRPKGSGAIEEPRSSTSSFEDFFAAERDGLFGAMCLVVGNRAEAEELTQEAFLRVWERWERIGSLEDPTGYVYRTAMNLFRKRYRRAKVALRRLARIAPAEDVFERAEAREVVLRALATLTPRQRAAVVLTELLDLTSEEAARVLGVKPVTVRVLASQGRAALA